MCTGAAGPYKLVLTMTTITGGATIAGQMGPYAVNLTAVNVTGGATISGSIGPYAVALALTSTTMLGQFGPWDVACSVASITGGSRVSGRAGPITISFDAATLPGGSSTVADTRAVADTEGMTDSVAILKSIIKAQADAEGMTDAVSITKSIAEVQADSEGMTDAVAVSKSIVEGPTDIEGMTDSVVVSKTIAEGPADAEGMTDSVTILKIVPPTGEAASSVTSSGFTANWDAVSGSIKFYLDVATDSGFSSLVSGYNNLDAGNGTSQAVSGLTGSTTYYYRLRVVVSGITSASSGTITQATAPSVPSDYVAYYPLTADFTDATGNHNGTAVGSVSISGGVGVFAGGKVTIANSISMLSGNFSYALWINPANVTGDLCVIGQDNGDTTVGLPIVNAPNSANVIQLISSNIVALTASDSGVLTASARQHISVTYNSTTGALKYYVNAVAKGSFTDLVTFNYANLMALGKDEGHSAFSGHMDHVRIYGRVLTADEVSAIVAANT